MAGYYGGQAVKGGFYLKHSTWQFESVATEGGVLPGNEETKYRRLPLPVVMGVGPLMGLAYVVTMPTVFCLAFCYSLARLIAKKVKVSGQNENRLPDGVNTGSGYS